MCTWSNCSTLIYVSILFSFFFFSNTNRTIGQIFFIRFKDDLRVEEVKKLLNSSTPVSVNVEQKPDMK